MRKFLPAVCFSFIVLLPIFAQPRSPDAPQSVLRTDASLVLVPAHVTTAAGRPVMTLSKQDFRLYEDNVEQKITNFSQDDAPVSIGLLFDGSSSMRPKMGKAAEAVAAFFKTSNAEDEFFLVEFSDRAKLSTPFTPDANDLYQRILHTKPFGRTSLLDAIYLALTHMKLARNSRRAIVIVSDGGDNWSRHSAREIRNALLESDVQVYAIGIFDPNEFSRPTLEEKYGPQLLNELAEQSGGRHYPVDNLNDLPVISAQLGKDLRNEYLLGYYSSNTPRDGKFHKVKVELTISGRSPALRTYFRRGYYAPSE